jgi:uncharacterized membrane protein
MKKIPFFGGIPYRALALLIPFLILSVHLAILYTTLQYDQFLAMIGLMVAYILPPAGKETVIPIGITLWFPWWYMALSIAMVDLETGLFMALNFDLAYRIPYVGKPLSDLTERTKKFLKIHRWFAGLSFLAVMLFVMVPGFGSGGFRGVIAGKLLGMETYHVVLAVLAGALVGSFAIALGTETVIAYLCSADQLPADISAIVCIHI